MKVSYIWKVTGSVRYRGVEPMYELRDNPPVRWQRHKPETKMVAADNHTAAIELFPSGDPRSRPPRPEGHRP